MLRQQVKKREGRANMCLADFIDPAGEDWIGGFAVAIHGIEPHLARFKADNDDYSDILLKALADRLAESFAERLHAHVRETRSGAMRPTEHFTNAELIRETYAGIRPAPGYPACPDHSLKPTLFDDARGRAGWRHPDREFRDAARPRLSRASISAIATAEYFGVARIGRDQLEDYAARRGVPRRGSRALAAAEPGLTEGFGRRPSRIRASAFVNPVPASTGFRPRRPHSGGMKWLIFITFGLACAVVAAPLPRARRAAAPFIVQETRRRL